MNYQAVPPRGKCLKPLLMGPDGLFDSAAFFENWAENPALIDRIDGHFALVAIDDDFTFHMLRDPLGVNKLFFAWSSQQGFSWSPLLKDLFRLGYHQNQVWSLPSACYARFKPSEKLWRLQRYRALPYGTWEGLPTETIVERIRARLRGVFSDLAQRLGDVPISVTLSGGLDSSTIAAMARQYFSDVEGVTFALDLDREHVQPGEDLHYARLAAEHIDMPLKEVHVNSEQMVNQLTTALVHGQDWRDFNVHCALVNACLGAHGELDGRILLTGDTMNELVADYKPVDYAGQTFYPLPRLKPARLRRFLVSGLDSGDREVGVFHHFDLATIQPYALCADAYTALPDSWLADDNIKAQLVRQVMGDAIPHAIYARPKVRAQVGNDQQAGGTLAAMVAQGLTGAQLKQKFAGILDCDEAFLDQFLRAGIYRSPLHFDHIAADPLMG